MGPAKAARLGDEFGGGEREAHIKTPPGGGPTQGLFFLFTSRSNDPGSPDARRAAAGIFISGLWAGQGVEIKVRVSGVALRRY